MLRRVFGHGFTRLGVTAIALALLLASGSLADDKADRPWRFAPDMPIDVLHLRLELDVDLEGRSISGVATLKFRVGSEPQRRVVLNAVDLNVSAVRDGRNGVALDFDNTGKTLEITWPQALDPADELSIAIDYSAQPNHGLNFFGPSETEPNVPLQVWSQGEPENNRHWFPAVDHPQERQTTEMVITAPAGYQVISNGRLVAKEKVPGSDDERWHWRETIPHTTYLVSLVVGQFDEVRDEDWEGKPVVNYLPLGRAEDSQRSFGNTRRMLSFFSDKLGVRYPYEKYAHVVVEQFSAGGMENTSATTLSDYTLHDERAHLDFSSDGLVAHELAHQWFGDLITCRDWAHLWLNEGFATYFGALWTEFDLGADEFTLEMWSMASRALGAGKTRPIVDRHYRMPREMFDGRAYPKGAWILHMLRRKVGDELWWKSIRRYVRDNAGRAVETAALRRAFEDETGLNLERFFRHWVYTAGHPEVEVDFRWLEKEQLLEVVIHQKQKSERPYRFSSKLVIAGKSGQRRELTVTVDEKRERILIPCSKRPAGVCFDHGQGTLKDLKEWRMPRDMLIHTLTAGSDPACRIEAARALGKNASGPAVAALAEARTNEDFWGVRGQIAKALGKAASDEAREALLGWLPEEQHPKARRAIVTALGTFHRQEDVRYALMALLDATDPSYRVEAAAASALAKVGGDGAAATLASLLDRPSHNERIRSAALAGLVQLRDPIALETAISWSRPQKPVQARLAALRALGQLSSLPDYSKEQREDAVKALAACLAEPSVRIRRNAIGSLRQAGTAGVVALALLDGLARGDPDGTVRLRAKEAAEKARKGETADAALARLRAELERVSKRAKDLSGRLEQVEAKLQGDHDDPDDGK